jgi:hypothetical protein
MGRVVNTTVGQQLNHLHRWCGTQGVGRDRQGVFSVLLAFWLGCGQGAHIAWMGQCWRYAWRWSVRVE